MSGATGRRTWSSSSSSASSMMIMSSAKRPAARVAAENAAKASVAAAAASRQQPKKRVALGNISNQSSKINGGARNNAGVRPIGAKGTNKVKTATTTSANKRPLTSINDSRSQHNPATTLTTLKSDTLISCNNSLTQSDNGPTSRVAASLVPCSSIKSPSPSSDSISLDETMSTCDSMRSPDIEYIDNGDSSVFASLERKANDNLCIIEDEGMTELKQRNDAPTAMEIDDVINVDVNHDDPQFCTTLACDIYKHLRIAETKKRPSTDFMEKIQKDINPSMRSILIDWLIEVADEYRLVPDTLYLTVNYIDRYLSGNEMSRQRLQLLGVACMLIAAKYEEICAPQVEEFCYITDNTYLKDEVIQMEADVLKYLKFEMTALTAKCFLRRFIRAAQGCTEVPALQLEFLANYIAELSLLEYNLLCFSPSLVAASAIFLAIFILQPTKRPWNPTLCHYTLYETSDLSCCVRALHLVFCNSPGNSLPSIREKYSQHKYKFVAKKTCPAIPSDYLQDELN